MIAFLEGTVAHVSADQVVMLVHGIGFRVFVTPSFACRMEEGQQHRIFTHQHVREDAIVLYGFGTQEERDLFVRLQSVSGIGPKAALSILGACAPETLCLAIQGDDVNFLTKLPGIGKKTAQRLIIDLKDKLDDLHIPQTQVQPSPSPKPTSVSSGGGELFDALIALGYTDKEVQGVIRALGSEIEQGMPVESLIKSALRVLART